MNVEQVEDGDFLGRPLRPDLEVDSFGDQVNVVVNLDADLLGDGISGGGMVLLLTFLVAFWITCELSSLNMRSTIFL